LKCGSLTRRIVEYSFRGKTGAGVKTFAACLESGCCCESGMNRPQWGLLALE
jgi:hypothetical protein